MHDAKAAERRAAMVDQAGGSNAERCAARRDVEAAWLKAEDQGQYNLAKIAADLACNEADLDRLH